MIGAAPSRRGLEALGGARGGSLVGVRHGLVGTATAGSQADLGESIRLVIEEAAADGRDGSEASRRVYEMIAARITEALGGRP